MNDTDRILKLERQIDFWRDKALILQKDCEEWAKEAESLYSIEEIADYVAGWYASTQSGALANALMCLEDDQDGIEAVRKRKNS